MNILFVSQCSKRALTETRRILDQFAERRGERTWQTPITQAGLDTVRKLLRQSARKNTAVACHWIRGQNHSELLWVVGDARQFNAEGAVPTDTTVNNILRREDENAWHFLPLMTALAALAALLHDLGKATQAFQDRLRSPGPGERNHYRHEWVSVRLFQAFVGASQDDADWLDRLASCASDAQNPAEFERTWLDHAQSRLLRDGLDAVAGEWQHNPFHALPPLAQALAWLVLTHHRLPCKPVKLNRTDDLSESDADTGRREWKRFGALLRSVNTPELTRILEQVDADWNEPREWVDTAQKATYWQFPQGLPVRGLAWRKQAARYARKLQQLAPAATQTPVLHDPYTMHVTRMCLMLADHHYSSFGMGGDGEPVLERKPYVQASARLAANTTVDAHGRRVLNQSLDEHLLGVQAHATLVTRSLVSLSRSLPALGQHKPLKVRTSNSRFQWQNKAADLAQSLRERAATQGCFIVNMASTGYGKTLGNARIMNALADPSTGMRCAFAMGLRTLTLQTGRSFQNDLGLGEDQLAIRVGGSASRALHEYWERKAEASGSASTLSLVEQDAQVLYEGDDRHPLLMQLSADPKVRALLCAPLLVCTVDHLTPATEGIRGGRQIAPMLRLMSGDLVLDEPDDFDMADLPALTRLVHWAGLLGSRVLLSSATMPPALVEGLFLAYRSGRASFQRHRGERPQEPVRVCCLWVDEFRQVTEDCADAPAFRKAHGTFADKRVTQLSTAEVRRIARIGELPPDWHGMSKPARREAWAGELLARAYALHQHPQNHSVDAASGKRVSFGLIRMANIAPIYDVALALYRGAGALPGVHVHLCVYHSQFPLLARSALERQLDTVLNRRADPGASDPILGHASIRACMDQSSDKDHLFIVLGSPVTEVGRDHDYDWAVVEPSSMRSMIQLAGRIRRHRPGAVTAPNICVLNSNLRAYEQPGKAAFCKPGFEMEAVPTTTTDAARFFHLKSHELKTLLARQLQGSTQWPLDARPRVVKDDKEFRPSSNMVDLEHARMHDTMLPREPGSKTTTSPVRAASLHWAHVDSLWLTGILPQLQRFRLDTQKREDLVFLPDDNEDHLRLHRVIDTQDPRGEGKLYVPVEETLLIREPANAFCAVSTTPWLRIDLLAELQTLAREKGQSLQQCAEQNATLSLRENQRGWRFHEVLGMTLNT